MPLERRKAKNRGKDWSKKEEKKLLNYLKTREFCLADLQKLFPERGPASIRSKVRKLRIAHDLFGDAYRVEKRDFTLKIAKSIKPKVVYDAYAGSGHQAFKWIEIADVVFAAEIKKSKINQFISTGKQHGFTKEVTGDEWIVFKKGEKRVFFYSGDTINALVNLKVNNIQVDLVDLDTCGSTLPTLPLFLIMLRPQHLVITHGEFHSMRFQREDVLRRLLTHRDVNISPLPLDVDQMAQELDKAVKIAALRSHNETKDSFWLSLKEEVWLGSKFHGMLRRHYEVSKPRATADCLNLLSS